MVTLKSMHALDGTISEEAIWSYVVEGCPILTVVITFDFYEDGVYHFVENNNNISF